MKYLIISKKVIDRIVQKLILYFHAPIGFTKRF